MKRKKWFVVAVGVVALVLGSAGVAVAITNGEPDAGRHPYVALLVMGEDTPGGFVPYVQCSGSFIAPDVILTAGHCTDGYDAARVWIADGPVQWGTWDPTVNPTCAGETGYPCTGDAAGTPHASPDYCHFCYGKSSGLPGYSYRDVGVVVFADAVDGVDKYAQLPDPGLVDTLKNKTAIDLVGYGVQYQAQIPGVYLPQPPPYNRWTGPIQRFYAQSKTVSGKFVHSSEYMRQSQNPGGGTGGSCFGDSGGPNLLGDTDTVLAITSYGPNFNCAGVGYSARVDIPEVLDWIRGFLS